MKKIIWIIVALAVLIVGVFSFNYFTLTQPVKTTVNSDFRNEGIEFGLHYKNYINPQVLVFNLKNVPVDKAPADVFRVFLQVTDALQTKKFESIELAYKGTSKFKMTGSYFKNLGEEYEYQNPVYIMRTFPQNVLDLEGRAAYEEWSGGILGVLNKQMEDFNDLNKKWFLDEKIEEIEGGI